MTTKEFPPGYSGIARLLDRMNSTIIQEGRRKVPLIKRSSIQNLRNIPEFFHLPSVVAPGLQNFQHEKICADVYAAYQTTGLLKFWAWQPHEEYEQFGLRPDRSGVIGEKIVFWEVDRGTEDLIDLEKKMPKYIELARVKQKQFHVVIALPNKGRAKNVLVDILPKFRRGNQLLVTTHDLVLADPLGEILVSPVNPSRFLKLAEV